ELKLSEVERQVLRRDVVIRAHDAALQQGPERLDAVGVDDAANVLQVLMIHRVVRHELAQVAIASGLISRYEGDLIAHSLSDESVERALVSIFDDLASDVALAGNRADHRGLADRATPSEVEALAERAIGVLSAEVGFIDFDDPHQFLEVVVVHGRAQPMA